MCRAESRADERKWCWQLPLPTLPVFSDEDLSDTHNVAAARWSTARRYADEKGQA